MQTIPPPISWGNMTQLLDQQAFEESYTHGRQYYSEDVWKEQRREGGKEALKTADLFGLIAIRDEQEHYQVDNGCHKSAFPNGVEELLSILVGYLSTPLHSATHEERTKRLSECVLIEE